jgi:hypothetical protein
MTHAALLRRSRTQERHLGEVGRADGGMFYEAGL